MVFDILKIKYSMSAIKSALLPVSIFLQNNFNKSLSYRTYFSFTLILKIDSFLIVTCFFPISALPHKTKTISWNTIYQLERYQGHQPLTFWAVYFKLLDCLFVFHFKTWSLKIPKFLYCIAFYEFTFCNIVI